MSIKNRIKKIFNWIKGDWNRALITALIFSLPFERIPSHDVFGITVRASLIIGLAIIFRCLYLITVKKQKIDIAGYQRLLIGFILWLALIIPESINIRRALEITAFNTYTIALALSVAYLFEKKYIRPIVISILSSTLIVSLYCLYQYVGDLFGLPFTGLRDRYTWEVFGFPRIQGTSLEPLYLASFMSIPTMIVFVLATVKNKIIDQKYANILLFIFALIVCLTVSRGGIYGLAFALAIAIVMTLAIKLTKPFKLFTALFVILAAFSVSILITNFLNKPPSSFTQGKRGSGAYVAQLQNTGLDEGDERSISRTKAIEILKQNKLSIFIGIGPGQYGPFVQNNSMQGGWTIVNNLPLELLLETGVVGILVLGAFFILLIIKLFSLSSSSKNTEQKIIAVGLILFFAWQLVQYQTYSSLYISHIWVAVGLAMGLVKHSNGKNIN